MGNESEESLIDELSGICNANGISFVVAGISAEPMTADMLGYCQTKGLRTVDISVDLGIPNNTNLPYDVHPSALAHRQYAQKLESFLCAQLIEKHLCLRR